MVLELGRYPEDLVFCLVTINSVFQDMFSRDILVNAKFAKVGFSTIPQNADSLITQNQSITKLHKFICWHLLSYQCSLKIE